MQGGVGGLGGNNHCGLTDSLPSSSRHASLIQRNAQVVESPSRKSTDVEVLCHRCPEAQVHCGDLRAQPPQIPVLNIQAPGFTLFRCSPCFCIRSWLEGFGAGSELALSRQRSACTQAGLSKQGGVAGEEWRASHLLLLFLVFLSASWQEI